MLNLFRPATAKTKRVWSAGGVICRPDLNGGIDVVLVGRTAESLWTLPKGTPHKNEPVEFTALREVTEETGLQVQPISHIRNTSHTFVKNRNKKRPTKIHKTVHWYLMRAIGGDFAYHDDEFDTVKWLPAREAEDLVTFGNEKRVIADASYGFLKVMSQTDSLRFTLRNTTIRSKRFTDAWDDYLWRSDPELAELDATAPIAVPFNQFQKVYARSMRRNKPSSLHLSIDDERGKHIGNCMCYDIDPANRIAEFGIMIGERTSWNKGYGTDATRLLLNHAAKALPVDSLFLHTLETNMRARTAFVNAGFKPTGTVAIDGAKFIKMVISTADMQHTAS